MKKSLLLCTVCLMTICTGVGMASNVSQNEKTLVIVADNDFTISDVLKHVDHAVIVVSNEVDLFIENTPLFNPPAFVAAEPLVIDDLKPESYTPYKEKRRLKTKYHARHLFNPLKTC